MADRLDGAPMRFCNNAAIATDGTVWFSDSSTKFGIDQWKDDFVQNTRTGRLARLGADGALEVVLDGLAFANGVALAADESYVAVAETGARTVVRWWLTGPKAGTRDFLVSDLPGYPDNIARGSDGLIWVSIASPKDPVVERLQRVPGAAAPCGDQDPRAVCSRSRSAPSGRRRTTTPARSCTTSTCRTRRTTWSPACGSTTAGSGWAASTSPQSPSSTSEPVDSPAMGILDSITSPRDLRALNDAQLDAARDRDPRLPDHDLRAAPAATSAPTSASSS